MSDQPDIIPMPEFQPDNRGPAPESFSRQLSPAEEANALINFMGSMYGETQKLDSNIVGPSTALERGKSEKIKRQIEQVYSQQQSANSQAAPPVQPQPQHQPQVHVEQPVQQQVIEPQADDNQLSFNFDVNEKDLLFERLDKLTTKVNKLHEKVDTLIELVNKPSAKKKSVATKKEN